MQLYDPHVHNLLVREHTDALRAAAARPPRRWRNLVRRRPQRDPVV